MKTSLKYLLLLCAINFITVSCGKTEFKNNSRDSKLGLGKGDDGKGIEPICVTKGKDPSQNSCPSKCDGELIGGVCYAGHYGSSCPDHGKPDHVCTKEKCGHVHSPFCGGECKEGNCGGMCSEGCKNPDGSIDYIVNFHSGKINQTKMEFTFGQNLVSEEITLVKETVISNYQEKFVVNPVWVEDTISVACWCEAWHGYYIALTKSPIVSSIKVYSIINNVETPTTAFVYEAAHNRIKYNSRQPIGASLKVKYILNAPLPKSFELKLVGARTLLTNTLTAKLDGKSTAATYVAATKMATIADQPTMDGSEVVFSYQTSHIGEPQLSYAVQVADGSVNKLTVVDAATGDEIDHKFENGKLIIEASEFVLGRKIKISYVKSLTADGYIQLSGEPSKDSLKVKGVAADGSEQICANDKIKVEGSKIKLLCDLPKAVKVVIEFGAVTGLLKEFQIKAINNPDAAKWTVTVDGKLRTDYVRTGNTVKFAEPLPFGSVIMVKAHLPKL